MINELDNNLPEPCQTTPQEIKHATQALIKFGLLESSKKPKLYQTSTTYLAQIQLILEPFDLQLRIDDIRGLAFLVAITSTQTDALEDSAHPLVRRQRLNLEQSLLLAILRKYFLKHELESGIGSSQAIVHLDDLLADLQLYLGDMGSEKREQTRLRNLLEKLKGHGVVSEINANDQVTIRSIIAHLANPENLANLLEVYRRQTPITKESD